MRGLLFLYILLLSSSLLLAQSPQRFRPGQLWLDQNGTHINAHGGGILFHEEKYYWFGEHKTGGEDGHLATVGVRVYSSTNLYDWQNEGVALAVATDTSSLLVKGCIIERPKVIYHPPTKTFVMWFHHELKGQGYRAAMTGLAVSDQVTGPYRYLKSVNPNAGHWPLNFPDSLKKVDQEPSITGIGWQSPAGQKIVQGGYFVRRDFAKGQMARDMTLFVDDDGKAYHIHSSENNQTLHVAELTANYQGFTGRYTRVLAGKANEAPAIFKKDGKYYMITSGTTGWDPNPARSAVADHPMGPWQELGNPCQGDENQVKTTFWSQSTYVLPVAGKKDAYLYLGDRWVPENPIDGRYIWLPLHFEAGKPILRWYDEWDLSVLVEQD